jgi:MFS family permease
MIQASLLALLALSGTIETWHIVVLALLLGLVHALEMPARHAFVAELVPDDDLPNAIALNSSVFNLARFAGPALAGAMIAVWSEGVVFTLNALSFLAVLASLRYIRPRPSPHGNAPRARGHVTAGLRHAWTTPVVRNALILLGIVSLAGTSYTVLMPVIAHRLFGGEADTLGLMLGAAGFGALLAALRLAWLGGRQALERQAGIAAFVGGLGMLALGNAPGLGLALGILVLLGFSLTTLVASVNTVLQTNTPTALRGRTMAVFSTLFIGFNSLGNLMSGAIAEQVGPGVTVASFGLVCLAGAGYYQRCLLGSRSVGRG